MTSIFERALGADYARLHPELQRRFGFSSEDGRSCVGTGVMDQIWRGSAFTVPFLWLGTARHILFPETGTRVPFMIENYAYRDGFGRETLTFVRTFEVRPRRRRRFDATMVYSPHRRRIVDFLGTHQHMAVDLDVMVDDQGGLHIHSDLQRFCAGSLRLRFPTALSGEADLHEWYDDEGGRFRINVTVSNRRFGRIFGYHGSFTVDYVDTGRAPIPAAAKPLRENPYL